MMFLLRDVIRKPNGAKSVDDQGLSERGKDPCETAMETISLSTCQPAWPHSSSRRPGENLSPGQRWTIDMDSMRDSSNFKASSLTCRSYEGKLPDAEKRG